jgi:hypothetical protein
MLDDPCLSVSYLCLDPNTFSLPPSLSLSPPAFLAPSIPPPLFLCLNPESAPEDREDLTFKVCAIIYFHWQCSSP